jgi:hypothetical protein
MKTWCLVVAGLFLFLFWGMCAITTVVPGSQADYEQRYGRVILPVLAILAFSWAALRRKA